MIGIIGTEKLPIKLWADNVESGALIQAKNLANLPFVFKHIALMPDTHQGWGMPIGGVMATKNIIVPNAVGVDIGCGMCAVKTSIREIDKETLKKLMGKIRKVIPVGFKKHEKFQDSTLIPPFTKDGGEYDIVKREYDNALKSLGTLGGGNHFIEIQTDGDNIWIMIHSGSRNLGKQVADHYNKIAKKLNERYFSSVPKEWDLAFLPFDSKEGRCYYKEMGYCIEFALANRKLMISRASNIIADELKIPRDLFWKNSVINIAHNYAAIENHFGNNVLVHRKGATRAYEGEIGIIPGSQGTSSYIVEGLGNRESFKSCSHGAGRVMSRTKARNFLDLNKEIENMEKKGIIHNIRSKKDLDEASSAYKDIDIVIKNQEDLVKVLVKLYPLAVIKG